MPDHLRTKSPGAFFDPDEPVPSYWYNPHYPNPLNPYSRQVQDDQWRSISAFQRLRKAQRQWGAEHGWSPAQVSGAIHPDWIQHGWADVPPDDGGEIHEPVGES